MERTLKKTVSLRQMKLLLEFLEKNRNLALGRLRSKEGRALSKKLWAECADILNVENVGASFRNGREWAKFYTDYKARLNNKVRAMRNNETTAATGAEIELTSLETRLCNILGYNIKDLLLAKANPLSLTREKKDSKIKAKRKLKRRRSSSSDSSINSAKETLERIEESRIEVDRLKADGLFKIAESLAQMAEAQNRVAASMENLGAGMWQLLQRLAPAQTQDGKSWEQKVQEHNILQ
ncbi:uncharacterized protein LOC125227480 [Leguminivora glycinivorella]|uniref:uncharacterized protein LOC125227480 n=1 Tax=Leguminivora glycinivorella TaxID=1035111 RepID=UPI0020102DA2|nr:uncharacterized protein LOC125227480 [Leguminivora glycinivorella]